MAEVRGWLLILAGVMFLYWREDRKQKKFEKHWETTIRED